MFFSCFTLFLFFPERGREKEKGEKKEEEKGDKKDEEKPKKSEKTGKERKMEEKMMKKRSAKLEKLGKKHAGTEDSTLKRTTGDSAAEKFRITYEARHIVGNYLGEGDPWEKNWRGALVVKGEHARLSNISDAGTWIEDEEYQYGGKLYKRTAGKSAGQVLRSYVQLRKEHPEWFEV